MIMKSLSLLFIYMALTQAYYLVNIPNGLGYSPWNFYPQFVPTFQEENQVKVGFQHSLNGPIINTGDLNGFETNSQVIPWDLYRSFVPSPYQQNMMKIRPHKEHINKLLNYKNNDVSRPTEFSARILPQIFNKMMKHSISEKDYQLNIKNETCINFGGALINEECYKYFVMKLSFNDARALCKQNDGDLWTPDFNDIYLFDKLLTTFPKVAGSFNERLWVGVTKDADGKNVIDINGNDVSDTIFIGIDDFNNAEDTCVLYSYENGYQIAADAECTVQYSFMCEYPIKQKQYMGGHHNNYHFKKYNYHKKW